MGQNNREDPGEEALCNLAASLRYLVQQRTTKPSEETPSCELVQLLVSTSKIYDNMKASVFIATSLDGFIARKDGSIDWLPTGEESDPDEDYGYQEFIQTIDAMVMGRNSYEVVRSFDLWPYGDMPVVVLSSREIEIPEAIHSTVSSISAPSTEVVQRLDEQGFSHLYIDGGKTIQGFLREGLIDQLIITRIPILIGEGIPLFGPLNRDIKLKHVTTQSYDNGLVQSTYEVVGD